MPQRQQLLTTALLLQELMADDPADPGVQQPSGPGHSSGGYSSALLLEEDEDGQTIADGLQLDSSWKVAAPAAPVPPNNITNPTSPPPTLESLIRSSQSPSHHHRHRFLPPACRPRPQGPRYGLAPPLLESDGPLLTGSLLGRDTVPRDDGARAMVAWKPAVVRHGDAYWSFFTQYNPTFGCAPPPPPPPSLRPCPWRGKLLPARGFRAPELRRGAHCRVNASSI